MTWRVSGKWAIWEEFIPDKHELKMLFRLKDLKEQLHLIEVEEK